MGTDRYLGWSLKVRRKKPSVHPGTWYDTCTGVPFTVLKPSTTPCTYQRDRARGSEEILRARNEQAVLESCGRHAFGRIPDWFQARERRTKERIVPFRGERANRLSTLGSIGRHTRQKHREMSSTLLFHGRIRSRSTNLHTICAPSRKVHPEKVEEKAGKDEETIKLAEVSFSLSPSTPSSSEACA